VPVVDVDVATSKGDVGGTFSRARAKEREICLLLLRATSAVTTPLKRTGPASRPPLTPISEQPKRGSGVHWAGLARCGSDQFASCALQSRPLGLAL